MSVKILDTNFRGVEFYSILFVFVRDKVFRSLIDENYVSNSRG